MESLRRRIRSTAERATAKGALVPIPTEIAIVEDRGVGFVVHVSALQENKTRAGKIQEQRPFNPFLPPDPDLFIGELPPGHISVLNKFNVLEDHLLIVTRAFEPQENLLNPDDFSALARCMGEFDGLGFYNGGTVAGASQPHKHLQLVPLPLGAGPWSTPMDSVIEPSATFGTPHASEALPFAHSLVSLDGHDLSPDRAEELCEIYRRACRSVGVDDETRPYNMLLCRRWMLVVPRSREFWRGVSINALAFAGSLLVRNRGELEVLVRTGPFEVLRSVVEPEP